VALDAYGDKSDLEAVLLHLRAEELNGLLPIEPD